MAHPDRPNFETITPRELGIYIRGIFELTPQEEAEAEEAVERVRTKIHELRLGEDVSVLDEVVEIPA